MRIIQRIAAWILPLLLLGAPAVQAEGPYQAYVYNEWNQSKASPNSYLPYQTLNGLDLGTSHLNEPQDLYAAKDGFLYVADTGNNRILRLDGELQYKDQIEMLMWKGQETPLAGPTGIYLSDDGTMYIADKGNGRILRLNVDREIDMVIQNPKHPLIPEGFVFKPVKVSADDAGRIYVLSEGQFFGLMRFDKNGHFTGYYGSNKVEVTPTVVLEAFWKSILSKEQREGMVKLLPIEYSNLDTGPDGFIYTTTIVSKNSREEIKKLNPLGNNVLHGTNGIQDFGDKEIPIKKSVKLDTSFVDITVDEDGFIAGLDRTRGRIFEYDLEGNPVAVFGALGNQKGSFLQPAAITYWKDSILVLDAGKRNITHFVRTEYGNLVHEATVLYNQGLYEEAATIWTKAAKHNIHNSTAYIGMAKALEKQGKYKEAMQYYKLGADRSGYSETYALLRIENVRTNLPVVMSIGAIILLGYYGLKLYRFVTQFRRKEEQA